MIVQEPIQAAIWHCLNNYAYSDAIFLAERLLAEVNSEESVFLLATVHYRSGKPKRAYSIINNTGYTSPQTKYLLAKCCFDLEKFDEAERILIGNSALKSKCNYQDFQKEYGSNACFVMKLLGLICLRTERLSRSHEMLKGSLKLNPFLWNSFATLCESGDKPDPYKVFKLDNIDNFSNIHGTTITSALNISNNISHDTANSSPSKSPVPADMNYINTGSRGCTAVTPQSQHPQIIGPVTTPSHNHLITAVQQGVISTPLQYSMASLNTPVSVNLALNEHQELSDSNVKMKKTVRFGPISPITPHFGVLPLNLCSAESDTSCLSSFALLSPSPLSISKLDTQTNKLLVNKRILCRNSKDSPLAMNKQAVFAPTGNNSNVSNPPSGQAYVRRSSRLFGSSSSVKENNKNRFVAPKSPARKTKSRTSKSQNSLAELNEKNKNEDSVEKPFNEKSLLTQQVLTIQKQSADGLMCLLRDIGSAYLQLCSYNCKKAIQLFTELPAQHSESTWVLSHIAKAHFEMNDYNQAMKYFAHVRSKDISHIQFMECYSTAMWHLQKESQLSALAQDLLEYDKDSAEAWCAAGNCYSLQKEHDAAIKYFGRAIQVDPFFAYSYSLLGHEHLATEELEKALSCYRSAIRLDKRHYNSWYGIGLVLFKQERFGQAEWHFRKAAEIHPQCPVLLCHIAVAQHTQKKSQLSLKTLDDALEMDPMNPLCKYHKASILLALDHYRPALEELLHLKQLIPRESNVYFLLSKTYKRLGDTHLALMNYSWAIDLDPKGANNQFKETIDPAASCCPIDEEDHINNNPQDLGDLSSSLIAAESLQESLILEASSEISGIEEQAITPVIRGSQAEPRDTPCSRNSVLSNTTYGTSSQAGTSSNVVLNSSSSVHFSSIQQGNTPRSLRTVGMNRHQSFSLDFDILDQPSQDNHDEVL